MNRPGGCPTWRLKAVLNVLAEPYPTCRATSSSARPPRRSRSFATAGKVFETNTFGTMAMVQAVIQQMRARRAGAIEGFTGSLAHELGAFGVWVKLVGPGYGPTTRFADNLGLSVAGMIPEPYADFARSIFEAFANPPMVTREGDVAEAVWLAANDPSDRLRYPAGPDAVALAKAG